MKNVNISNGEDQGRWKVCKWRWNQNKVKGRKVDIYSRRATRELADQQTLEKCVCFVITAVFERLGNIFSLFSRFVLETSLFSDRGALSDRVALRSITIAVQRSAWVVAGDGEIFETFTRWEGVLVVRGPENEWRHRWAEIHGRGNWQCAARKLKIMHFSVVHGEASLHHCLQTVDKQFRIVEVWLGILWEGAGKAPKTAKTKCC